MSTAALQIKNLESLIDTFRLFPKKISEELEMAAIEIGELLTVYARDQENHRWEHRFNNLEKDIGSRVFNEDDNISLAFGLGFYPSMTQVEWNGDLVSYGTILHDGDFEDPWIDQTWEQNEKEAEDEYNKTIDDLLERLF